MVGTGPGAAPEAPGQSIGTKDRAAMPCLWFLGLLPLLYPQLCPSGCHCQVLQGALPFTQKLGKQTWGGDLRHVAAFLLGTGGGDIASHLGPSTKTRAPLTAEQRSTREQLELSHRSKIQPKFLLMSSAPAERIQPAPSHPAQPPQRGPAAWVCSSPRAQHAMG